MFNKIYWASALLLVAGLFGWWMHASQQASLVKLAELQVSECMYKAGSILRQAHPGYPGDVVQALAFPLDDHSGVSGYATSPYKGKPERFCDSLKTFLHDHYTRLVALSDSEGGDRLMDRMTLKSADELAWRKARLTELTATAKDSEEFADRYRKTIGAALSETGLPKESRVKLFKLAPRQTNDVALELRVYLSSATHYWSVLDEYFAFMYQYRDHYAIEEQALVFNSDALLAQHRALTERIAMAEQSTARHYDALLAKRPR